MLKEIMKTILTLFVLFFSSSVLPEDISDFEIEGISIGDSLLDYMQENEIKNEIFKNKKNRWSNKVFKFGEVVLPTAFIKSSIYDSVYVFVKPEDSKYKIHSISGAKEYKTKDQCLRKLEEIKDEFSNLVYNLKLEDKQYKSTYDPSGKSIIYNSMYTMKSGDIIMVECAIFDKLFSLKKNWVEITLRVIIRTNEVNVWL